MACAGYADVTVAVSTFTARSNFPLIAAALAAPAASASATRLGHQRRPAPLTRFRSIANLDTLDLLTEIPFGCAHSYGACHDDSLCRRGLRSHSRTLGIRPHRSNQERLIHS